LLFLSYSCASEGTSILGNGEAEGGTIIISTVIVIRAEKSEVK
jgi:hypothetical protein